MELKKDDNIQIKTRIFPGFENFIGILFKNINFMHILKERDKSELVFIIFIPHIGYLNIDKHNI